MQFIGRNKGVAKEMLYEIVSKVCPRENPKLYVDRSGKNYGRIISLYTNYGFTIVERDQEKTTMEFKCNKEIGGSGEQKSEEQKSEEQKSENICENIKGLDYIDNSCYMDSVLLCTFLIENDTITKHILQKDLNIRISLCY